MGTHRIGTGTDPIFVMHGSGKTRVSVEPNYTCHFTTRQLPRKCSVSVFTFLMVSLKLQKRLAASILKCGARKIWMDPNEVRIRSFAATPSPSEKTLPASRGYDSNFENNRINYVFNLIR